jgi:hypothetical protein
MFCIRFEKAILQEERGRQHDGKPARESRHLSFPGHVLFEGAKNQGLMADPVAVQLMPVIGLQPFVEVQRLESCRVEDWRQRRLRRAHEILVSNSQILIGVQQAEGLASKIRT